MHLHTWLCVLFRLLLMDITVISVLLLEFIVSNSKGTGMEIGTERIFCSALSYIFC